MGTAARKKRNLRILPLETQQRVRAVRQAMNKLKLQLHAQLDAMLADPQIGPEVLAAVSVGMGVTVGLQTKAPPTADQLDPNAEAVLAQRTGVLDDKGEEVRRIGLEPA